MRIWSAGFATSSQRSQPIHSNGYRLKDRLQFYFEVATCTCLGSRPCRAMVRQESVFMFSNHFGQSPDTFGHASSTVRPVLALCMYLNVQ